MSKINKLGFLSLLGLIGILGLLTNNREYIWFIGFFGYLGYFKIIPDELFKKNVNAAASIGFFSGLGVTFILVAVDMFIGSHALKSMAFALGFAAAILAFSIVLIYLGYKEQRGSVKWD